MSAKTIDTSDIVIRIQRSNRRSVSGRVLPDSSIEVRAPLSMTTEEIHRFLDKYEPKFLPLVAQHRKMNAFMSEHPFGYGGKMLFRGEWTTIREAEDDNSGCVALYKAGAIVMKPGLSETDMRLHISFLFCDLAIPVFEEKLHHYSDVMGVMYKSWTIGNARKRHGSCDFNGKITLSWLVVMMSEPVIEYIIVHELAHLKHMNHSKSFQDEVEAVLPDWKERRKAYGEYGLMLRCSGWV